ncbi:leucine-rich repeat and immunoglobulin-like domain-containing nogo receptor-interacting protein 3 [Paramacrobiotus metropolitanus]|uniref:leucine-rich repeat and immunoglobulin-like domain-containing nogo receptor-interacting protein 3 n=1 Tax=Paramacrobiotus metropolitanus TaxID=2943436 RepID=UPI002445F29A|nr:leucine-rich repeat and immunoglobulin-like domain-containing nogo receptor-interacting protein 3 [Paramacrobiotus metropolitanus]XP_055332387.1 leucine-rich repeat and immunoglobulin-like domain-containing nogo receptor-interacting protein 3 [Paramacrobiotus metropolitanus]XP_055332389.1 leucine-rich repeat and immunoglobulin-like domain-containing nogo receptor-interacting protein 3 [Paramacrobiotus metropolitanus]XP_055332390.1 leucine-rich repeat and immunoglobulin-like domain-containing 
MVFPNLTTIKVRGTRFIMELLSHDMVRTKKPLKILHIINNDFSGISLHNRDKVIEATTVTADLAVNAEVDFSGNRLPVTKNAIIHFAAIRNCRFLSLRDDEFQDYVSTSYIFQNFTYLETLDLSNTFMLKSPGSFAGLPKLRKLLLAGNDFEDLTFANIFEGSKSINLEELDISYNGLTFLPKGLKNIVPSLRRLRLAGNKLNLEKVGYFINYVQSQQFTAFPKLQLLDLSRNKLETFAGSMLSHVLTLETLNLGCNYFRNIHKGFFSDLPQSLRVLNLSMCYNLTK